MSEQKVVKASGTRDFLQMIPSMIGYVPQESVLLVPFHGSRTIGAMRFDVPADGQCEQFSHTAAGMVTRVEGTDRVAIIVYTSGGRHLDVIECLRERFHSIGLGLVDGAFVTPERWGSPLSGEGGPAEEVAPADMGLPVREGVLAGTEAPEVPEATIEIVERALANIPLELLYASTLVGAPRTLQGWFERQLRTEPSEAQAMALAILVALNDRPSMRDMLLVQIVLGEEGGARAEQAQLDWEEGAEYPAEFAAIMWGDGAQPDDDRLKQALALYRYASAAAGDKHAGILAMCGWLSWALGLASHAEHYANLAVELEPEHGLSEILLSFIRAGHLPDWAFTKRD